MKCLVKNKGMINDLIKFGNKFFFVKITITSYRIVLRNLAIVTYCIKHVSVNDQIV